MGTRTFVTPPTRSKATPAAPGAARKARTENTSTRAATAGTTSANGEAIARRAYELFIAEGGIHGRDLDHWLMAEQELAKVAAPAKRTAPRARRNLDP